MTITSRTATGTVMDDDTAGAVHHVPLLLPVDVDLEAGRANDDGFGDVDTIIGDVRQLNGGLGDDTIICTDVGAAGCNHLYYGVQWRNSSTISKGQGIDVTINGVTNRGTVDKGDDGTDTLVDIATQLNSTAARPYGYTALYGSFSDDTFDLTMGEGQLIGVRGLAGNDTFHLSGSVRLDYRDSPSGINANLGAGRATTTSKAPPVTTDSRAEVATTSFTSSAVTGMTTSSTSGAET